MKPTLEQLRITAKTFLSDEAFKEQADGHAETLKPDIGDGGVMPKLLVTLLTDEGYNLAMVVIQEGFEDEDKKYALLEAIGDRFAKEEHQAVAVFLASEAWLSTAFIKNMDERPYEKAGDDPNRTEAVVIAGQTLDQRRSLHAYGITRGDGGNIDSVTQLLQDFDLAYEGTLQSDLLDAFWKGYMLAIAAKVAAREGLH